MLRWAGSHPEWELGYEDECWWSRVTDPHLHAWAVAKQPLRLISKQLPKGEPKALACYGIWLPATGQMLLRFVLGRPVSTLTVAYLEWVSLTRYQAGKQALFLVWDNAAWHGSQAVRTWLKRYNRQVMRGDKAGVWLIVCRLPAKAPWLNPIEPKWLYGKRTVAEAARPLETDTLHERVYAHFDCPPLPLFATHVC